jgi:hypothetical protein
MTILLKPKPRVIIVTAGGLFVYDLVTSFLVRQLNVEISKASINLATSYGSLIGLLLPTNVLVIEPWTLGIIGEYSLQPGIAIALGPRQVAIGYTNGTVILSDYITKAEVKCWSILGKTPVSAVCFVLDKLVVAHSSIGDGVLLQKTPICIYKQNVLMHTVLIRGLDTNQLTCVDHKVIVLFAA